MVLVFVFLASFSLLVSRLFYRSYLSPIGLFGLIWNGLLALTEMRLINYYPLSLEAHGAFIGSYALFLVGALLTSWPAVKLLHERPDVACRRPLEDLIQPRKTRQLLDAMNLLGLMGLMVRIWQVGQLVGWSAVTNMSAVRSATGSLAATEKIGGGFTGYLSSLLPLVAIISGVYWVYSPRDWKRVILCLAVSFGLAWLTGNRTVFIWTSVLFFFSYTLTRAFGNRESVFRLLRPILLGVILLFMVFGFIGARRFDPSNYSAYHANLKLPWALTHIYSYVTSGFAAFSVHLEDPVRLPIPGALTLSPAIRMLARVDPALVGGYTYEAVAAYTVRRPSVTTPAATNVFTFLGQLFDDFGWGGVFLIPLFMGTVSGWIFQRLLLRPSFGAIAWYAFFCLQFVYASTSVITHANSILVSMMVLAVVQRLVSTGDKNVSRMLPVTGSSELSEQSLRNL